MNKLILILAILFASLTFGQDEGENNSLWNWGGLMANINGNLFTVNRLGVLSSDNLAMSVLSGRYTLANTGAEIDILHGGTFDSDLDITGTATNQLKLPLSNDAVTPTIAFGDGDSGIYQPADDQVNISLGGAVKYHFQTDNFQAGITSSFFIRRLAGTLGLPTYSFGADPDLGIYREGADILGLVAGGVLGIRISESTTNTILLNGSVNFAADAQADDDYEISLTGVTALVTGMTVTFTANTANTDGVTLEITEVGDLDAILKMHDQALATGDIESGQVVVCVFDGSNWQMTSQVAQ